MLKVVEMLFCCNARLLPEGLGKQRAMTSMDLAVLEPHRGKSWQVLGTEGHLREGRTPSFVMLLPISSARPWLSLKLLKTFICSSASMACGRNSCHDQPQITTHIFCEKQAFHCLQGLCGD